MDRNSQSPSDTADAKMAFRKPSNDAANRKYRRRSPVGKSSSSDGSPKHERSSSPILSRQDPSKAPEHRQRRKGDGRELDRDSGRTHYDISADSYGIRQSSRNSHGYTRHDDYIRHDKHSNEEDSNYHRLGSRSGRESRGGTHSGHSRQDNERGRSRDYSRDVEKYSRDKYDVPDHRSKDKEHEKSSLERQKYKDCSYDKAGSGRRQSNANFEEIERDRHRWDKDGRDGKRDCRRSSGDRKSEEYRGHSKEAYKTDLKELGGEKSTKEEKNKYNEWKGNRDNDSYGRAAGEDVEDKTDKLESPAKKPKLFSSDKSIGYGKDADEKQSSSSKQAQEIVGTATVGQTHPSNSEVAHDLNAAKVAAMKAAELVNRNLVGVGYLSADQKKKLLWGKKKTTTAEESGHHWDTALIGDRERQEKFNKLMGVKGDTKMELKPVNEDGSDVRAEKQKELQLDLEKQYTAGLRRRDGRTVGLGL